MMEHCVEIYKEHCRELSCLPTEVAPVLKACPNISTVIFDLYGTLFISGSGDIGSSAQQEQVLRSILEKQLGLKPPANLSLTNLLTDSIKTEHLAKQKEGILFPEVDIREHWASILKPLGTDDPVKIECIATLYEAVTNPVWPMPNAADTLADIQRKKLRLGVISNAQFYTHALFPALLPQVSFAPNLSVYSYQEKHAKPGLFLFEKMVSLLSDEGIAPDEVLYIGNDMRNDINPANQVGFNPVLFAGDERSYRPRIEERFDPPDYVITDLSQLTEILS